MSTINIDMTDTEQTSLEDGWRRQVLIAVQRLRYGSVEIVVHEGRVVQIETREKVRFDGTGRRSPDNRGRGKNP